MAYIFRVTLSGIKGFYRVYKVNGTNSLYSLHKQMRSDMEFPLDQPILFKALDENGNVIARYALVDLGFGTVDHVSIADALKAGISSFVYFYDIQSKKSVNVTFEGEEPGSVSMPQIVDSKGPNPIEFENGYVAFEDLPEDKRRLPGLKSKAGSGIALDEDDEDFDDDEDLDDDDEEDEDDDREEEETIYDESEGL